ncbi:MAG: TRAP transporter small permease [Pseudoflavonifractor sp.]|nr:TRAP transporter small permease [Pseudoflavonifractor sp.]
MRTRKVISTIYKYTEYIGCAIIALLAFLVVLNVITRRFFSLPIFGITEIVQYGTLAAISLAAANTTYLRNHPSVSILVDLLKPKAKSLTCAVTELISMGMLGYVGWNLIPNTVKEFNGFRTTESLFIPYWVISAMILFCILSVMVTELILMITDIVAAVKPETYVDEKKGLSLEGSNAIVEAIKDVDEVALQKEEK